MTWVGTGIQMTNAVIDATSGLDIVSRENDNDEQIRSFKKQLASPAVNKVTRFGADGFSSD